MPNYNSADDDFDDEEWYSEDGDETYDAESGHCPECSAPVQDFMDKCPACGRWFSDADRRAMWSGSSKPKWVLVTAGIVLIVLVLGMLTLRF